MKTSSRTNKQWIARLDKLYSLKVRSKGRCERCGKTENLQTSHIFSRTNKELRWDLRNSFCLCAGCHFWWHKNPIEAVEWCKKKMGVKEYEQLRKDARKTRQWFEKDYQEFESKII